MSCKITSATATLFFSFCCVSAHAALHCSASATSVAFGTFPSPNPANVDSTGTISIECKGLGNGGASYTIALNMGSGNSFNPRKMTSGSNILQYNLYSDSTRSVIWGDGTSGTSIVSDTINDRGSATTNYIVYGRVHANQNVPPGNYSDIITVTVSY